MKQIKELVEFIEEELEGASKYAEIALAYKLDNKPLADYYARTAEEELKHSMSHHEWAVNFINEYKATGAVVPEKMLWIWEKEHEEFIEKYNEIKIKLAVFKGV